MKKLPQIHTLFILFVCCLSCQKHTKKELPKENAYATSKKVVYGPNSITRAIKQDSKGNIWFASWEGIIKYDGTSFTNITNKISSSRFFSVLEDRKGNFWFASIGSGVYYYDGNSFQNFTTKEGLVNNRVTTIYEDKKGNVWFGTEGGVSCYNGISFQNFTTKEGMPHNDVNAIIEDETGKLWFGTRGNACFYDGKTFTNITNKEGITFKNIRSIIEDKRGNIWLGGNDGLWQYNSSIFRRLTTQFVGYIYEDKKGNIWMSSESNSTQGWALSYYDITSLFNPKPLATEVLTQEGMLFGILEDSYGVIWVGTLKGAYRYAGNTLKDFKIPKLKESN